MKKIISLLIASLIGGFIALFLYVNFFEINEKQNSKVINENKLNNEKTETVYITQNHNLDFTESAEKTVHSVVHVKIRSQASRYDNPIYNFLFGKPNYNKEDMPIVSSGSGVIISSDGYIVTNNHVVKGADALEVTLNDNRTFEAKLIGTDPTTDIALLKIEGSDFSYLKWGNSDNIKVGEWVLAVGNPFNLASTVTAGIVSAKSRSINIINNKTAVESFIQTDAAVNPGNSGGALVNIKGELIGINTAIASPTGSFSGYSFAVPQSIAQKVVADIIEFGYVQRAFIGASITNVTARGLKKIGINSTKGVYVYEVFVGGAAYNAGLKSGDIILKIENTDVNSVSQLQAKLGEYRPGDKINILVNRNEIQKKVFLTLTNMYGKTDIKKL